MAAAEYRLKIVRSLHDEWARRRIERHIPALAGHQPGVLPISAETLTEIDQDARLMLDPTWFDLVPEERRVYRALVAQCGRLKAIGPIEAVAQALTQHRLSNRDCTQTVSDPIQSKGPGTRSRSPAWPGNPVGSTEEHLMARNVYVVEADGHQTRLIEASQSTQALAYAARTTYSVRKASQQDLIKLLPAGIKVEKAIAEPELFEPEPEVKVDPAGNVVALAA